MATCRCLFIVRCPVYKQLEDLSTRPRKTSSKSSVFDVPLPPPPQSVVNQPMLPSIEEFQILKNDNVREVLCDEQDYTKAMEMILNLNQLLIKQKTRWSTWFDSSCGKLIEVHFTCNEGAESEKMIEALSEIGIGKIRGSGILVLPVSYATRDSRVKISPMRVDSPQHIGGHSAEWSDTLNLDTMHQMTMEGKLTRKEFIKSIRSRLTVPQVFNSISSSTRITFDYVSLVILASLIAALGLRSNSSVIIVASMLISPLMGPILAMVFALTIFDRRLMILGLKAETLGLILCLLVGAVFGVLDTFVRKAFGDFNDFPTKEMCDRCQTSSLIYGVFVALPSGAGVALSVLGGNIGSLVGVAISASLLPPAVNCGLLFGLAIFACISLPERNLTKLENLCPANGSIIARLDNMYVASQAARFGAISLALTIVNIVCILFMGMVVLKIKQVSRRNTFADKFWDDLKATKRHNFPVTPMHTHNNQQVYVQELADHYGLNVQDEPNQNLSQSVIRKRIRQFEKDMSQINSDLNMITTNVYRYGPATRYESILEDMLPSLPPKWTTIFQNSIQKSGRFEVRPTDSIEDLDKC